MQASTSKKKFRPGEMAPITGVYLVEHGLRHRDQHEVVIIRGEQLPTCRECKLNVSYEILHPISHITHDWDFSGPHNLMVKPKDEDFKGTRLFRRINVEWPITVELCDSTDNVGALHGHSIDLSAGGISAIIRSRLPSPYKTACVKILLDTGDQSLALQAHCRYQSGMRYGFEFSNVSSGEKETIRRLIETQLQHASDTLN